MGVCTDAGKWHCHRARSTGRRGPPEGVSKEEEAELIRDTKKGHRKLKSMEKSQKMFPSKWVDELKSFFLLCFIEWVRFITVHKAVLCVYLWSVMSVLTGGVDCYPHVNTFELNADRNPVTVCLNVPKIPWYNRCPFVKCKDQ